MELRQEVIKTVTEKIPETVQQVQPLQKDLEEQKSVLKNQKATFENHETTLEELKERLSKVERGPQTVINQTSDRTGYAATVMVGKYSNFKIPTFDGTGPLELYHKQFEVAAAHSQ